jgi:pimeloyl-ACP methyl ester carboxylesterase
MYIFLLYIYYRRYINIDDYVGGFEKSDVEQLLSNIESDYHNWATRFASLGVDTKDPLSVEKFSKCLKRMRPEVALSLAKTVFYSDERDVLDKVVTPCTIIHTTNDFVVPNSVPSYMQKKIKAKSTVEIIDADGHFPQLTSHLRLLDVLRSVLGFDIPHTN